MNTDAIGHIKDLPEDERKPFKEWLRGHIIPPCPKDTPIQDHDAFYMRDYERWKQGLPHVDGFP